MSHAAVIEDSGHRRLFGRGKVVVTVAIVIVTAMLYLEWRSVRAAGPGEVAEQDTMCMASRIGLPCR